MPLSFVEKSYVKFGPQGRILLLLLLLVIFSVKNTHAQLDSIHWIPPITSTDFGSSAGAYEHFVYLSTHETTAFNVTVTTGTGTLIGTYSISNASPYKLTLAIGTNYLCLQADSVGSVQREDGLILSASKKFYANYRICSTAQGGSLTAKGRIARGTDFYWGGISILGNSDKMNAVLGIMAIEDNTTVTIDEYDPNCEFRLGALSNGITSDVIVVTLNAGETFVLECVNLVVAANAAGWLGAHVTSDKDIVMNNGNLMGGVITGSASRDICFDQTLPVTRLGNEYITLKGNGIIQTEQVIIIATEDGTDIRINGAAPITTINRGDYYIIDGSNYSVQGNMYIKTGKPSYTYQLLAGSTNDKTIGLNFIPPLNCMLPNTLDNISDIDKIGTTTYTGGVTILTRTGATVLINGAPPVSSPNVVSGNSNWVTYSETGLTGNISVVSDEPMAAGMFGANGNAGFAGYFSGFSERPTPEIVADDSCATTAITLLNIGENIQWHFNGSPQAGDTSQFYLAALEGSYYTIVGSGTCKDTSNTITLVCNILPIELAYFDLDCNSEDALLRWETVMEHNNDYFEIWRSRDGFNFEVIDRVYGQGNSTQENTYTFHPEYQPGIAYYRLSQTDYDGKKEFFNTVSSYGCEGFESLIQLENGELRIMGRTNSQVRIYDQMGRLILEDNTNSEFLNVDRVPGGLNFVSLSFQDGHVDIERLFFP